jgi:hypothetical protein
VPSVERPGRRARLVVGCRRRNSCTVSYRVPSVERPGRRARLVVGCHRRNSCTVSYRVPSVERPGRRARLVVGCRRRNSCTVTVRTLPRSSVEPPLDRGGTSRQQPDIGLCRDARSNRHSTGEAPVASRRTSDFAETLGRTAIRPGRHQSPVAGHRTLPRSSVEPPFDRGGTSRQSPDIGLCREARSNRHSTGEAPVASRRTSDFAEKLGRAATRPGRHQSPTAGHRTLPRSSVEPPFGRGGTSRQSPDLATLPRRSVEPPLDRGGISRQQPDIAVCRKARSSRHSTAEASVVNSWSSQSAEKLGRTATRSGTHQSSTAVHRTLPQCCDRVARNQGVSAIDVRLSAQQRSTEAQETCICA